ncbi:MAG: citramalate synthase [Ignisphaera sp.]
MDTTLRDGSQASGISLTVEDKIKIALALDDLGVDYIEAGWPGSNPKDAEFFNVIKRYSLSHAKIAAFGSTRKKNSKVYEDENVKAILKADVDFAVIFGKSWSLHVYEILHASKEENLEMIYDTINYLKSHGIKVIFDAEHFYQGYKEDPEYSLETLRTAEGAGAQTVVLCDTNGGTTPLEVYEITRKVVSIVKIPVGLHMHNDIGCAVANTIVGVVAGARHVQGTINGIGERTGNADLVQIIPTLFYKLNMRVLNGVESIKKLKTISKLVYEILNMKPNPYQPYVGDYAFAHKAGVHVDAVLKNPRAYEHIDPEAVGNTRRFVLSDLSGSSNIVAILKEIGIDVDKKDSRVRSALSKIKELEKFGYSFDIAPASAILIALKELGYVEETLTPYSWRVFLDSSGLSVAVVDIKNVNARAIDVDVVKAVARAFSEAASIVYPSTSGIKLINSSISTLNGGLFRVTVEVGYNNYRWSAQGVSINVIEAFIRGLVDAYEYFLAISKKSQQLPIFGKQSFNFLAP